MTSKKYSYFCFLFICLLLIVSSQIWAATYYVRESGAGDGSSWANSMSNLQLAIESCQTDGGGEVWVAAGTYKPFGWPNYGATSREVHFSLRNGVTVYGGFPATGTPVMGDRDVDTYISRCSGDVGTAGDDSDNAYHVFYHPTGSVLNASAVMDGVWITDGRDEGITVYDGGGGVYCRKVSPTITNCVFTNNAVEGRGGGLLLIDSTSRVTSCRFINNAAKSGGGLKISGGWPIVADCVFTANTASAGGGLYADAGRFSGCLFEYNKGGDPDSSTAGGGAMHVALLTAGLENNIIIENCIFIKNNVYDQSADDHDAKGGAVYASHRTYFINCAFMSNSVAGEGTATYHDYNGGGVYSDGGGAIDMRIANETRAPQFRNCVFYRNTAETYGGGVAVDNRCSSFAFCTIVRNTADKGGGVFSRERGTRPYTAGSMGNSIIRANSADGSWYDDIYTPDDGSRHGSHESTFGFWRVNATYKTGVPDGSGNIDTSVDFLDIDDPDGADNIWFTADDGLSLQETSTCIDAGYTAQYGRDPADIDGDGILDEPIPLDIIGNMRNNGDVDMGAYEYGSTTPPVYTVEFDLTALGTWAGGGALTQEVADGCSAVPPEVTPDPTYFHSGWDVEFMHVTNDLLVTAQYTQTVYEMAFDEGDHGDARGFLMTVTVEPGENVCWTPAIIPDEGWYHTGWSEPLTNIVASVTNVALYAEISLTSNRCYVKENATGSGASWADPMGDLQQAMNAVTAAGTGEVWVAAGTYRPNMEIYSSRWGEEYYHFSLRNNVTVYGGFPATGTPGMGDRDPATNLSICSGFIEGLCGATTHVYNVFYHPELALLTDSAILDGFVIEKGRGVNATHDCGGGMYNASCNPQIRNCVFRDNYARRGGGVYNSFDPSPGFFNCRFETNNANTMGGAMRNFVCSPTISNCVFSGNTADFGGAMANDTALPAILKSLFRDNDANDWGGAVYNGGSRIRVFSCAFVRNTAERGAGAYNDTDSHAKFVSTVFTRNDASIDGGAIYNMSESSPMIVNCTVSSNPSVTGGGIMNWNSEPSLFNSIVWDNPGGNLVLMGGSTASVVSCIIEGGYGAETNGLDADPRFLSVANPAGADGEWFTSDDGFTLQALSPAVNAGSDTNMALDILDVDGDSNTVEAMMFDAAWTDRLTGVHVDMGAYEDPTPKTYVIWFALGGKSEHTGGGALVQTVEVHEAASEPIITITNIGWTHTGWNRPFDDVTSNYTVTAQYEYLLTNDWICYVREDGSGDKGGTAWSNACDDVQEAIEAMFALGSGQVWVAEGSYIPSSYPNGGISPRDRHFSLRDDVTVLGGFPPQGDPGMGDRDPRAYPTVCSADIGTMGVSSDNTYHVFYHPSSSALGTNAILDGFILRDGNASSGSPHDSGGGMYNKQASPVLRNCILRNNYGHYGGGIYNGTANPELTWCVVDSNSALYGGGIFNRDGASPSYVNLMIHHNGALEDGGAVYNQESDPVYLQCAFFDNNATDDGGAIYVNGSTPVLQHCVITANSANDDGGGLYTASTSSVKIVSTIIWTNTATSGAGIQEGAMADTTVTNSLIQDGFSGDTNVIEADPLFVNDKDPDGPDNDWFTTDDGLYLSYLSPAINAANTNALPNDYNDIDDDGNRTEILPLDLGGRERVSGLIVDIGPYETVTHEVTFNLGSFGTWIGGGALTQYVAHDGAAELPGVMLEAGWELVSWIPSYSNIVADTEVFAVYGQAFSAGDTCYVRTDGTGSGVSWEEATWDLQGGIEAIAETSSGQVWVAAGTYLPQEWPNGGSSAREVHFSLRNNVQVYGGFPDSGSPGMSNRDPRVYGTLLSGNLGSSGTATDNAYHVFFHNTNALLTASARLDGFSIISGYADGSGDNQCGGGMLNDGASPTLVRCHFSGNAAYNGGGLWNWDAGPVLANCIFRSNGAGNYGGGICNNYSSAPVIINGLFIGNTANDGGGILNDTGCNPKLYACTFTDNSATNYGGAIANGWGAAPVLRTCILSSNSASSGNSIYATAPADTDVDTCLIEGGWATGTNVLDTNPVFNAWNDPDGPDKVWRTSDDGLMVSNASPAFDYGSTSLLPADIADLDADGDISEALPLDLRESPRVAGFLLDLGCYESDAADLEDYGDAPESYGTLLADQGARHALIPGGPYMGPGFSADTDGQPSAGADSDDDDGVIFPAPLVRMMTVTVQVDMASSPADGALNLWIDYNQDGAWQTNWFDEHVIINGFLGHGLTNSFQFTVPSNAWPGVTYARFRCNSSGSLSPWGGATDGEVEDYMLLIGQPDPGDIDIDYIENMYPDKYVLHWNCTNHTMVMLQGAASIETYPVLWTNLTTIMHQSGDLQTDVSPWLYTLRFYRILVPYIYP